MRDLLNLRKSIEKWRSSVELIPSLGGAQEEMLLPDIEEREDRGYTDQQLYNTVIEELHNSPWWKESFYRRVRPIPRTELHLFRYFIDGSLRNYYLGEVVENERFSPLLYAQIGACMMTRDEDGHLRHKASRLKHVLVLDFKSLSEESLRSLRKIFSENGVAGEQFEIVDASNGGKLEKLYTSEIRYLAAGKMRYKMRVLEVELARSVFSDLSDDTWLVVDGSLMFEPFHRVLSETYPNRVPPVIGISKSFRKDPQFVFGRWPWARRYSVQQLLSKLDFQERTPAFAALEGRVAFWYVRLWSTKLVQHPLMGIVKCELVVPQGSKVPIELIDMISGVIVAERNVSTHGQDSRWHAHLYPIFSAERYIKNMFYSRETVQEILRWR